MNFKKVFLVLVFSFLFFVLIFFSQSFAEKNPSEKIQKCIVTSDLNPSGKNLSPEETKKNSKTENPKFSEGFTGIKMAFIKGGCFDMGDNFGDGSDDEKPVHTVCLDDFYLSETEVTGAQWEEIMGYNPSYFKGSDRPVEQVSWNDVQEFLSFLNKKTGGNYRLPTEAEMEYASRDGGKIVKYETGRNELSHDEANYFGTEGKDMWFVETSPVKSFPPNSLGLYDMAGNVWEWCADWYDKYYYKNSPKDNPKGPSSGSLRVLRSGVWNGTPGFLRSSYRFRIEPRTKCSTIGFRVAQ